MITLAQLVGLDTADGRVDEAAGDSTGVELPGMPLSDPLADDDDKEADDDTDVTLTEVGVDVNRGEGGCVMVTVAVDCAAVAALCDDDASADTALPFSSTTSLPPTTLPDITLGEVPALALTSLETTPAFDWTSEIFPRLPNWYFFLLSWASFCMLL